MAHAEQGSDVSDELGEWLVSADEVVMFGGDLVDACLSLEEAYLGGS